MLVSTAAIFAGCGCDNKKSKSKNTNKPGYEVVPTEPDLKDSEFGYYRLNNEELMVSTYFGDSDTIKIPETFQNYKITVVGHSLFNSPKKSLKSVEIPDTVTEVQDYAFAANNELSSVKLSKNLKVIGNNAFWDCPKLTSIELPSTLKKIGVYAFSATGLTSVVIPDSKTLNQLDQFVFFQSKDLKEVTIPASLTNIADNCFNECHPDLTIKGKANSYALSYAEKHNYKAEAIS